MMAPDRLCIGDMDWAQIADADDVCKEEIGMMMMSFICSCRNKK
jgi:hypothetical protein